MQGGNGGQNDLRKGTRFQLSAWKNKGTEKRHFSLMHCISEIIYGREKDIPLAKMCVEN